MARTEERIRESLIDSIEAKDVTIDVTTGPFYDGIIYPVPVELAVSEQEAARLGRLHSPFFAEVATIEEVDSLRVSMRLPRGTGERASGLQLFWSSTFPSGGLFIPKGSLAATKDGKFVFITTEERTVPYENRDAYFNSDTNRYEIIVPVEAIASGEDYNIPQERINNLLTELDGVDGTVNYSRTDGGTSAESKAGTVKRIQEKFVGFDRSTTFGLDLTYIRNAYPTLTEDVAVIRPSSPLFVRPVRRTALDVYLSGTDSLSEVMTYTLTEQDVQNIKSNTFKLALEKQPVLSIEQVDISGIPGEDEAVQLVQGPNTLQYMFVKDEGIYYDSYRAQDQVWIKSGTVDPTKLVAGQRLTVNYTVEGFVTKVQENLFNRETTIMDTDVLVRKALEGEIVISVLAKLMTDPADERSQTIKTDLEAEIVSYIEDGKFGRTIQPESFRQAIKSKTPSVIELFVTEFHKKHRSYRPVETVEFNANQIPKVFTENGVSFSVSLVK
jgi:hypothetical protein